MSWMTKEKARHLTHTEDGEILCRAVHTSEPVCSPHHRLGSGFGVLIGMTRKGERYVRWANFVVQQLAGQKPSCSARD